MVLPALALLPLLGPARAGEEERGAAPSPAVEAEAAEARGDWAAALQAWERCVEASPEQRRCRARAEELRPQAADGFAGWAVLAEVRRDYRHLGTAEAEARILAAVERDPAGPAAPELMTWLANEASRRGDDVGAARWRDAATASPGLSPPTRAWLEAGAQNEEARRAERRLTYLFSLVGVAVLGLGAARRGPPRRPLALPAAGLAFVLLGLVPMAYAQVWGAELDVAGFGRMGLAAAAAVAVAPRLPPWLAAPGAAAGVLAVAGWNGWLGSMGLG